MEQQEQVYIQQHKIKNVEEVVNEEGNVEVNFTVYTEETNRQLLLVKIM